MKVGDGFPAVGAVVDDQAVAGLVEFQLAGDLLGGGEKVAEDGVVFGGDGGVAGVVLFGDEKNVDGGLGSDVPKGEDVVILIDNVGRHFAVDDPFKDRFGHGPSWLPDGQLQKLGTEMAGAGADEVNNLVVETLAGASPGGGAGKSQDAGTETFQAEDGGEGGDFFVHDGGETLEKHHFHGVILSQRGQVDGGGGGGEFEMAGNGGATDPGEGTAQDHFQGIAFDDRADEVVPEVVQDGAGHFRGQSPFPVAGPGGGFFQGENQPRFVKTGGLDSGGGDQGQGPGEEFFSGHRGF
jgi:hypothetical protein